MFITSMRGNERIVALRQIRGGGVPTTVYYHEPVFRHHNACGFLISEFTTEMGHRDSHQVRKREMCIDLHSYRLLLEG